MKRENGKQNLKDKEVKNTGEQVKKGNQEMEKLGIYFSGSN